MAYELNEPGHRRLMPRTLKDLLVGWVSRLGGLGLLMICGLLWLALITWSAADPSFSTSNSAQPANFLGGFGAAVSDLLLQTLGLSAVLGLCCLVVWGLQLVLSEQIDRFQVRAFFALIALIAIAGGSSALPTADNWQFLHGYGGILGDLSFNLFAAIFTQLIGQTGGLLAGIALFVIGFWTFSSAIGLDREKIFLIVRPTDRKTMQVNVGDADVPSRSTETEAAAPVPDPQSPRIEPKFNLANLNPAQTRLVEFGSVGQQQEDVAEDAIPVEPSPVNAEIEDTVQELQLEPEADDENAVEPSTADKSAEEMAERFAPGGAKRAKVEQRGSSDLPDRSRPKDGAGAITEDESKTAETEPLPALLEMANQRPAQSYRRPSLNELQPTDSPETLPTERIVELGEMAQKLTDVLADFRVKGEIRDIRPGPVVTLFEFEPARGTKSSRIIALADDVARSMSAASARIAVIAGRNAIGIELPNAERETVMLRELLETDAYRHCDARLPLTLGKGIAGEPVIADLARMPHLLVAGTTGSGKSVGVNAMILSLLYRKSPEDCRFLMIDPKMLELSAYNGIPHLLAPVITDPQQAVLALHWAVGEMEERYKRMTELGVRSIDVYNNRVRHAKRTGDPLVQRVHVGFDDVSGEARFEDKNLDLEAMPHIVIIVDEFADLMCVAGREIEAAVQRLAQMARAAGMHMIMATQRPSVDVVTGTIKANFPTRIGYSVASKIDSRTILNEQGAEQLLGQGDMLLATGGGPMLRAHGPFVADEEVEAVASALRAHGPPAYASELCALLDDTAPPGRADQAKAPSDLYDEAVAIVKQDGRASTSYLQRRLSIGYNRAANLMERMEEDGVITPADRSGKRKIVA